MSGQGGVGLSSGYRFECLCPAGAGLDEGRGMFLAEGRVLMGVGVGIGTVVGRKP